MWQQCHLEAKVRLQLRLALLRSQEKSELPPPPGSGFLIQILEGMQKKEKRGGKRTALSRCPCSKLSAVPVCELGLAGAAGSWQGAGSELCAYLSYLQRLAGSAAT